MLTLEDIDLADLSLALEDHSHEHSWWMDPATGDIEPSFAALALRHADGDATLPGSSRFLTIEPLPVAVGYGDLEDFVAYVRDARARDLLERAIVGRGAFRRFKDALSDFPELRRAWFTFHDGRGERRAIEWLLDRRLIDRRAAEHAIGRRADPEPGDLPGLLDAQGLAHRVARDLRPVYRRRLRGVLLIGPWAAGDAHPEAAVELLVVLDAFGDRWAEKRRMEQIMWRHSIRNDVLVTAYPVLPAELERATTPLLVRAAGGGMRVL